MYYDFFETDWVGRLTLVGDATGLRHIDFPKERRPVALDPEWQRAPDFFTIIKNQLQDYFEGRRKHFDLPLAPRGTPFQRQVWRVLQYIPYGTVTTYQWVATRIGNPKAVRAVGGANARNPLPIVVPCHRVIGRNGHLTGFGGGLEVKERLIALEQCFA